MVSEGVDIPRLRVGVYATAARTELFFRQVVGRFVRRTPAPRHQMSHVFLPADPRLKALAATIEEERAHALRLEPAGEAPDIERSAPAEAEPWHAVWSSARAEDEVLQTTQPGEALQLFADAAPRLPSPAAPVIAPETATAHGRRERLRDERRALVAAISRLTGEPHRAIHARVNRASGAPSVSGATVEQLERGNALLEREASGRAA